MNFTRFVAIWASLAVPFFAPNVWAQDGGSFRAELTSHSAAVLGNASEWSAAQAAFGLRNWGDADLRLRFAGNASTLLVHRFSESWQIIHTPDGRQTHVQRELPSKTTEIYREASFSYQPTDSWSTAIVFVEAAALAADSTNLTVKSVARDPVLVARSEGKANLDERASWYLDGSYLSLRHEGLSGRSSGGLRFYMSLGVVNLETSEGTLRLESRAWDDPTTSVGGTVRTRTSVWYELESRQAETVFSAPGPGERHDSMAYARRISASHLSFLTFDSVTRVTGSLPPSSHQTGPSLWIGGSLSAELEPETPEATGPGPRGSYKGVISGAARAYSIGGGSAISLAAAGAAAATGTSLMLLAGLALLWKLLSVFYIRLEPAAIANHPVRRTILDSLERRGPMTAAELMKSSGHKESAIRRHLRQLLRAGAISSHGRAWRRRYKLRNRPVPPLAPPDMPVAHHVLSCLGERPVRFTDLCRAVQARVAVSKVAIWKAVRRLERQGRVGQQRLGRQLFVGPTWATAAEVRRTELASPSTIEA